MLNKIKDEYYLLTEKLEEIEWALDGKCDDIDCDKYMYKDLLKKKYGPVLEHNFSCMKKLESEKQTIMRLLSNKKYNSLRYIKCPVCKTKVDKLGETSKLVSFTRPSKHNIKCVEWNGVWTHNKCRLKVKIPEGWKKF